VYCSVLQCVAVCCSVLQCVAVCCSVLQCIAVCCSVTSASPRRRWRSSTSFCSISIIIPFWDSMRVGSLAPSTFPGAAARTVCDNYVSVQWWLQHTATHCNNSLQQLPFPGAAARTVRDFLTWERNNDCNIDLKDSLKCVLRWWLQHIHAMMTAMMTATHTTTTRFPGRCRSELWWKVDESARVTAIHCCNNALQQLTATTHCNNL